MSNIDPILVSVLASRFKSLTEEMGLTLLRTTRSPILCQARDFVTGVYDASGRMLEQTEYLPVLAFSLQPALEFIIEYFRDDICPGDVILHNDVFSKGNQLPDLACYKPIFFEGKLVAWAATKGHQADIGGAASGGYNPRATEVWQEGMRVTPVKVYEKGILRRDVWDLIFANVRFPIVEEDMRAEVGACVVGERGIEALIKRYGLDTLQSHVEYLFDSTERMMRNEIRAIPTGAYEGESYIFYDGIVDNSRYKIKVTITVDDGDITFDYTGTDSQSPGYINAPFTTTFSHVMLVFLMLVNPDIPHNDGMTRPIHLIAPEGTIVNAKFPAATTMGNHIACEQAEAILKALAKAVPERVTAAWKRVQSAIVTGVDPRRKRPYVDILFLGSKGGSGGTYGVDGYDHIGGIYTGGGHLAQDYEMLELTTPHFLLKHEYWTDSSGAGQWRGGLGVETVFRFDGEDTRLSVIGDGVNEEARGFGLFGGKVGSLNQIQLAFPDGRHYTTREKDLVSPIPKGTIFHQQIGGGGGYGHPFLRPIEKVAEEVINGFISVEKAKADYGVVIDPLRLVVCHEATKQIRSNLA